MSKGSSRRPQAISTAEYARRYEETFGEKMREQKAKELNEFDAGLAAFAVSYNLSRAPQDDCPYCFSDMTVAVRAEVQPDGGFIVCYHCKRGHEWRTGWGEDWCPGLVSNSASSETPPSKEDDATGAK